MIAVVAIFLPSFLLLGGVLPLWSSIRTHASVQAALVGIGAAVVGVLAAALWNPVLTTSIDGVGERPSRSGCSSSSARSPCGQSCPSPPRRARFSSEPSQLATATTGQLPVSQSPSLSCGIGCPR